MIEEILTGLYKIEVPLPGNPLKALNSYLIRGTNRHLLIDTGFNQPECLEALNNGMDVLGIDWCEVDFYVTHLHWDHAGLLHVLANKDSKVYISEIDAGILQATWSPATWKMVNSVYLSHGYPENELVMDPMTMEDANLAGEFTFTHVKEGDVLEYGSYSLHCVSTPGHTPGHMCLYEPNHRFLVGGDHILTHISSNITARPGIKDALGQYLESLDKVEAMDIRLVLPGHREILHDYRSRIYELKHHHMKRLDEIVALIVNSPMSAYQVASLMHWDLKYDRWELFPKAQKWFATGEAIAHLDHLALSGRIRKLSIEEGIRYQLHP